MLTLTPILTLPLSQPPTADATSSDAPVYEEELDVDLGVSLARARRLAQMKEKAKVRKSRDVGEVRSLLSVLRMYCTRICFVFF